MGNSLLAIPSWRSLKYKIFVLKIKKKKYDEIENRQTNQTIDYTYSVIITYGFTKRYFDI